MSDRETTADLLARLRRHYIKPGQPLPGGVFVPECGINGGSQTRCDALYAGFTSTSGRLLVGHEIKASRADWRKELDSAGKADRWADNCHAWYIVAPSTEIVPPEELPNGWGLMVPNPRTTTRMSVVVKAEVHSDRNPSWQLCRSILARLDTLRAQHDAEVRQRANEQALAEAEKRMSSRRGEGITAHQQQRIDMLDRLEAELDVEVAAYTFGRDNRRVSPERLAAALQLLAAGDDVAARFPVMNALPQTRGAAEHVLTALGEFEQAVTAFRELVPQ